MLEWNQTTEIGKPRTGFVTTQSRRLQIALVLLLGALAVVVATDRDFWFGTDQASESDAAVPETKAKVDSTVAPVKTGEAPAVNAKQRVAAKTPAAPAVAATAQQEAADTNSPVVATNRTVLPPLDVEVVAGDTHHTVHSGSNVAKVEISNDSNRGDSNHVSTNAAEREHIASAAVPELRQTIDSNLPLLAQNMKVQGSVVLQAVVGADGNIENLRVVSGPAILSAAAQQAVREWRFKPYLQNGQPVETKARITVNFSIRISDNSAKTS